LILQLWKNLQATSLIQHKKVLVLSDY